MAWNQWTEEVVSKDCNAEMMLVEEVSEYFRKCLLYDNITCTNSEEGKMNHVLKSRETEHRWKE